jgi:hypothetical protein
MSPETTGRLLEENVPFAIQALDKIHHGTYNRWVKAGVAAAAGAYALVALSDVLVLDFSPVTVLKQSTTVGLCILALWLAFRSRLEVAGTLTIGTIWLELRSGLLSSDAAILSISGNPKAECLLDSSQGDLIGTSAVTVLSADSIAF